MTESISEDDKLAVEQFVVVLYDQVLQNTLMKPDWICLHGNRKHMKRYPHLSQLFRNTSKEQRTKQVIYGVKL